MNLHRSFVAGVCAVILVGLVVPGCDVDVFGFDARPVVGDYKLLIWESGKYSLIIDDRNGCGVVNGTVERLAWNESVILADQKTCGGTNSRSGWVVIDVKKHIIEGPIDPATIPTRADLVGLTPIPAGEVWDKLPWR